MTSVEKVSQWIELFGEMITENREHLNKLDTAIGDGDHGSNLTRGAAAVKEKAAENNYDNLADLFKDVGMTLVSTRDMKATKGRASYLGDRSIGHIDPGAQSSAYLFEALLETGVLDE